MLPLGEAKRKALDLDVFWPVITNRAYSSCRPETKTTSPISNYYNLDLFRYLGGVGGILGINISDSIINNPLIRIPKRKREY